eukprot:1225930-Pyramimonas_sp.AAC.1
MHPLPIQTSRKRDARALALHGTSTDVWLYQAILHRLRNASRLARGLQDHGQGSSPRRHGGDPRYRSMFPKRGVTYRRAPEGTRAEAAGMLQPMVTQQILGAICICGGAHAIPPEPLLML